MLAPQAAALGRRAHRFLLPRTDTMLRTVRLAGALAVLLAAVGAARADSYFVVVFGAQSRPPRPKYSHSWAVFLRLPGGCAPGGPPAADAGPPEVVVISWLPCVVELHPNRPLPEEGRNFDLHTTFRVALEQCEYVMAWGPYEITERLFCRAKRHAARLESGAVKYKTIDFGFNTLRVSNCIHALTVFNRENARLRIGRTNFGHVASYYIADSYAAWIVNTCQEHCWVADLLGLGQYPIQWRRLEEGRPRMGE
jgi:hypothetical protein